MQLIFQGGTLQCLKDVLFVHEEDRFMYWEITHISNHWSNQETMRQYIDRLLAPLVRPTGWAYILALAVTSMHPDRTCMPSYCHAELHCALA